ncbi:MAG: molecular chaperone TorD family protein [Helicobacter sp.]|nr:molecular chaperone TorD family protein [Helicobacter sp.]
MLSRLQSKSNVWGALMLHLTKEEQQNIQNARNLYYDFFNGFFVFELIEGRLETSQKQILILKESLLEESLDKSLSYLQEEIKNNGMQGFKQEHTQMFALPFGEKQVGIHLSHYYENCIGGESLLTMRSLIKQSDIRLNRDNFKDTEEHIGFLFGLMRYLIQNNQDSLAKEVFLFSNNAFLGLCGELQERGDSKLYLHLALLLESFLKFEKEFYN